MADIVKSKYVVIILLALILAAAAVFWQVRTFEFINLDDFDYLMYEGRVQQGLTADNVLWALTTTSLESWQPLVWMSFMLDAALYGNYAGGFHFTNLILHILSTVLLFWAMNKMTGAVWRSAFVAAFFAIHPVHVESVAWIAERKDTLSGLFFMLTLCLYIRYVKKPDKINYALVLLFFIISLMSKPILVMLPVIFVLVDYWPLCRFTNDKEEPSASKRAKTNADQVSWTPYRKAIPVWQVKEKLPFFVLSLICGTGVILAQISQNIPTNILVQPFASRVANAFVAYIKYIINILAPYQLAVFYPFDEHLPLWLVALCAILFIGLCVVAVRVRKQYPFIFTGWGWFVVMLAPVIGIIPLGKHAMADRFTYLSAIGISFLLAWGVPLIFNKVSLRKKILMPVGMIYVCVLGGLAWVQCGYWQNDFTLFGRTLDVTKNNDMIHYNLGWSFMSKGDLKEARKHWLEAVRINPQNDNVYANLGISYLKEKDYSRAFFYFTEGLKINSENAILHSNYGILLEETGKAQEAADHYRKAIQLNPKLPHTYYNYAKLLIRQDRAKEAEDQLRQAIIEIPHYMEAHDLLAGLLMDQGKKQEAISHYQEALKVNSENLTALSNLGILLAEQSRLEEAIVYYSKAAALAPDDPKFHFNLGIMYSMKGDLLSAREQLQRAVNLKPDSAQAQKALKDVEVKLQRAKRP